MHTCTFLHPWFFIGSAASVIEKLPSGNFWRKKLRFLGILDVFLHFVNILEFIGYFSFVNHCEILGSYLQQPNHVIPWQSLGSPIGATFSVTCWYLPWWPSVTQRLDTTISTMFPEPILRQSHTARQSQTDSIAYSVSVKNNYPCVTNIWITTWSAPPEVSPPTLGLPSPQGALLPRLCSSSLGRTTKSPRMAADMLSPATDWMSEMGGRGRGWGGRGSDRVGWKDKVSFDHCKKYRKIAWRAKTGQTPVWYANGGSSWM